MRRADFDFELPESLIAKYPTERRDESRLMRLEANGRRTHHRFGQLPEFLRPSDLLVVNDSAVFAARFVAQKAETGGRVEVLLVEPENPEAGWEARVWRVLLGASKPVRTGQRLNLAGGEAVEVKDVLEGGYALVHLPEPASVLAERWGQIPIPPYLRRDAEELDKDRYQTIYANRERPGSVAAPTAGLHFTKELLANLDAHGVQRLTVTLHVGPGTFLPVRSEDVSSHRMHRERFEISAYAARTLNAARDQGRRVVAVGTTTVRVLESFGQTIESGPGSTDIFIVPGHRFRWVDALITNFHLPGSTLIMLVAALAGREKVLSAYEDAVQRRYRFFSYGDAMLAET